ncbi:MAG: ATP-NAD kinase [Chloroflexi bacterium]|jgi:predicted polyphosphate/ATP-dependent NAD kinase|nr:ATP-NAD kinase [Chloroflexota bacterium]
MVNPIAGMGGSVGLKGTDGGMYERAVALGADPVTPHRTATMLQHIEHRDAIQWLTAPGAMGAEHLAAAEMDTTIVGEISESAATTSAADTRRIAQVMRERGAALLVFVGGDGTARDVYDAIAGDLPVVAVPAGVKVYSAAFTYSPRAAAGLIDAFIESEEGDGEIEMAQEEVLDIDEEAFRENHLDARLYGYLRVPDVDRFVQPGKRGSNLGASSEENKRDIAASVVEEMAKDGETLYLLGPGTTVRAVAEALEIEGEKTLLGVDAVAGGELVGTDLNETDILALIPRYSDHYIVVTPIGGNGFIFGRGNKQFTPEVIRQVGQGRLKAHIIVVSTERKARELPALRVDTDDAALDEQLSGYIEVQIGYHRARMMKVKA